MIWGPLVGTLEMYLSYGDQVLWIIDVIHPNIAICNIVMPYDKE